MLNFVYPQSAMVTAVTAIQVPYLTGIMRLFSSPIVFTPLLNQAELVAIEATFTGYAEITYTTLPAPFPDQTNGGVSFMIPTSTFVVGATPTVTNEIFGGWLETAAHALLMAWQTTNPWPMQTAGQALPVEILLNNFGNGLVQVQYQGIPQ